jgi:tRNA G10  N-methylase Trm11
MIIAILGRQPDIGLAELRQVYGLDKVQSLSSGNALVNADVNINRLGGSIKTASLLSTISIGNDQKILDHTQKEILKSLNGMPEGKLKLGISLYGIKVPTAKLNAFMLSIKKNIKKTGRSVRVIPNKSSALSSAQTLHNQLTSPLGIEVVIVRDGSKILLGRVNGVQDIDSYAFRDRSRPKRDAFVGMLPPKLAQIMINLSGIDISKGKTILDPFCGTGVLLQEAALLGFDVYGTDLSEKMVGYSTENMQWVQEKFRVNPEIKILMGDAMTLTWKQPIDAVVCETYLGQPFSAPPNSNKLEQVVGNCNHIIENFLQNIHGQLKEDTPLCIAVPAWSDGNQNFTHLPLATSRGLAKLGYKMTYQSLLYYREDQIVARQLLCLRKITGQKARTIDTSY